MDRETEIKQYFQSFSFVKLWCLKVSLFLAHWFIATITTYANNSALEWPRHVVNFDVNQNPAYTKFLLLVFNGDS